MMTNRDAWQSVTLRAWADQVMECQASGMTVKAWCNFKGINSKTYYYHKKRLREAACKEVKEQEKKTPVFAEIKPVKRQQPLPCATSNIAVTLSIGNNLLAVHNGADKDTVSVVMEMVLNL